MKSKLNLILISCILFLGWTSSAKAQTAPNLSASHLQTAESFLIATGVNTKFPAIVESIINTFSSQVSENDRPTFISVMRKFMNKYYTWDNLKLSLDKVYAAEFTEIELKQMIDFYNSPVGKKYSEKLVQLMQQGMQIGQQVIIDHQSELEQMVKEASSAKN